MAEINNQIMISNVVDRLSRLANSYGNSRNNHASGRMILRSMLLYTEALEAVYGGVQVHDKSITEKYECGIFPCVHVGRNDTWTVYITGCGVDLGYLSPKMVSSMNFCPSCGKKISNEVNNHDAVNKGKSLISHIGDNCDVDDM